MFGQSNDACNCLWGESYYDENGNCACRGNTMSNDACPDGWQMNSSGVCLPPRQSPLCPDGWIKNSGGDCEPPRLPPIETTTIDYPIFMPSTKRKPVNIDAPIINNNNANTGIKIANDSRCASLNATLKNNTYHYFWNGSGCAFGVNYDRTVNSGSNASSGNFLTDIISSLTGNTSASGSTSSGSISDVIGNNKGLVLLGVLGLGYYLISSNKRAQPKTYDRTESYKY